MMRILSFRLRPINIIIILLLVVILISTVKIKKRRLVIGGLQDDMHNLNQSNLHPILLNRNCFVVAENDWFSMVNNPREKRCEGFNCWESQLTVFSKAKITLTYNNFREAVMKRESSHSMMKVNWHWSLEHTALQIISTCPATGLYEFRGNIEGSDDFLTCEYSVAIHPLLKASREEFLAQLYYLLKNNYMHDFDEHQDFRRSSALFIGCALTIIQSTEVKGYLVCMYCSKEKSIASRHENCVSYTRKDEYFSGFSHLCSATEFSDLYGCEPKNPCFLPSPNHRLPMVPGRMEEIYAINSNGKIWLAINYTSVQILQHEKIDHKSNFVLYTNSSENLPLNVTSLPELSYAYSEEISNTLKMSFPKLFTEKSYMRRTRQAKMKKLDEPSLLPETSAVDEYYPHCCIYLFILNLLLMISLLVLIYFTYKHYVVTHPR